MEKRGFERTIMVAKQKQKLPWGTYIGYATATGGTKEAADALVSQAVKITGYTASYVIVETDVGMQVSNLEPAEQPKSALDEFIEQILKNG
jgi:hypothetical protein